MYKPDLALNNQQWLICHKSKPNQTIFTRKSFDILYTFYILLVHGKHSCILPFNTTGRHTVHIKC